MLIRGQMLGELLRTVDRRADQTVATQPLHGAIPRHVAVSKARRQQPRRHAVCRQAQGIVQLIDVPMQSLSTNPFLSRSIEPSASTIIRQRIPDNLRDSRSKPCGA